MCLGALVENCLVDLVAVCSFIDNEGDYELTYAFTVEQSANKIIVLDH